MKYLYCDRCHFRAGKILYFVVINFLLLIQISIAAKMTCKRMKPENVVERGAVYFTNTWAVRIKGGVSTAKVVAKRLGYDFHKKVSQ